MYSLQETRGAFHSTKNSGLNQSEIFRCRMERYFPPGRTDLVQFQLEHISHQELLEKMLKDHDESGCLKCRIKLLHVQKVNTHSEFNSSLIFMRETYELFSRESMQTGRTDPQEIRSGQSTIFSGNQILTFSLSIKNRLELWQNILHPV